MIIVMIRSLIIAHDNIDDDDGQNKDSNYVVEDDRDKYGNGIRLVTNGYDHKED